MNFKEWLNEGTPANWAPTPRIGHDPLISALVKIKKAQGNMPFNGNFADLNAFQVRFNLAPDELEKLKAAKLLTRNPYGFNVDPNRFNTIYQQFLPNQ